jgi:hypothetical protein
MDEIRPPATRPDLKPEVVSHLKFKRDAGTSWARSLSPSQVADLVDLAGELATIFPVVKERRVTEKQFNNRLKKLGLFDEANSKTVRIVGWTSGLVTPFTIWWSYCWVFNYTRAATSKERTEEEARDETANRMGMTPRSLNERLARRDISYLSNLFLVRRAREMEGEIKWQTALDAVSGGSKAQEMYFRHVAKSEDSGSRAGDLDPWNRSEEELKSMISQIKKEVGEQEEMFEDAEVDVSGTE